MGELRPLHARCGAGGLAAMDAWLRDPYKETARGGRAVNIIEC
ncbi:MULTISPECIES: hypothetical protein [unclassified Streptomyces]